MIMGSIRNLSKSYSLHHAQIRRKNILFSFKRLTSNEVWEKDLTFHKQKEIEEKWKNIAINYASKVSNNNLQKNEKKYILSMFPYPSGNLHLGHVRVYSISDTLARFYHMKGYKVIHPMGWDAFGLPAENAAIETGEHPEKWTKNNIKIMKKQLKDLGFRFDWQREISTCDPEYYKWTQFIFLKLLQHGLAYKQEAVVNWDPVDQTVLANEQVDENGQAWRSGAKVEKKLLSQWYLKCKKFSKELFEDVDDPSFENWRDVSAIQKGWIGDCRGYIIEMKMVNDKREYIKSFDHLSVWMNQPEYLENVAFLGIRSDHILNSEKYKDPNNRQSLVLNIKAIDPIFKRIIPIVVTNSLVEGDAEFYVGLPHLKDQDKKLCLDLNISLPSFTITTPNILIREEIVSKLKKLNSGGYQSSAKLKDWLISRQRYWGTPIPVIYCTDCGIVPVPEKDLPVKLPHTDSGITKGDLILNDAKEWLQCSCPRCGKLAERETDTMDTFVDSSWYYLRYLDPNNNKELVNNDMAKNLLPVDLYVGGKEHALLHLYYARFMHKFLTKIGLATEKEPFKQLLIQGMVKGESYQVENTGKYLRKEEIDFTVSPPVEKKTREALLIRPEKMSKSKYNGVVPQTLLDQFGIDALRLAVLSFSGPQTDRIWNTRDMNECFKTMLKLWWAARAFVLTRRDESFKTVAARYANEKDSEHKSALFETRNKLLLIASNEFEVTRQLQLVITAIRELINGFWSVPRHLILSEEYEKSMRCSLLLLCPFCPHLTSELWERVNSVSSIPKQEQIEFIFDAPWPTADVNYERVLVCKVNEEEVCTIRIPVSEYASLTQEKVVELAYQNEVLSPLLNASPVLDVQFKHYPEFISSLHFQTKPIRDINIGKKEKRKQRRETIKQKKEKRKKKE